MPKSSSSTALWKRIVRPRMTSSGPQQRDSAILTLVPAIF